ncbi:MULTISPECIES: lantibiotic dehydratase [unclassified Streptomyces]|uniref:lantibiotic dehydratase n=1 Tax=unclassified Streptomyces TaxID=2593676 RepID=UPI001BE8121F|nr:MULTISPECIES: lantibiotic dehydratase [unclassified Streptomyces]MBT2405454.1 lantibiotic dehydratase [Streptomyces sp. ISL-21]MBT2608059.1 lantibiotic dehydratase [Streptomyces sp. ISL-87]
MVDSAPIVVSRVCGLPVRALEALRAEETLSLVRMALDREDRAERITEAVADDLHRLVPTDGLDRAVRRGALRLRRDVHNLRLTGATEQAAALVSPWLDGEARDRLELWCAAVRERAALVARAERAADKEIADAGAAMTDLLREERIARGLSLASPSFTLELLGHRVGRAPAWDSRLARSAAAYLSRTAVKPSPFGTLTTVGVAGWDGPADGPAAPYAPLPDRVVSSSRAAALDLLRSWAGHPDAPAGLRLLANPSVRTVGGRELAALPLYCHAGGVFLRADEITDVVGVRGRLSAMPAHPVSVPEAIEALGADAASLRRLVTMGVLLPVTPWSADEGSHFTAMGRSAGQAPGPVAEAVRALGRAEELVAGDADAGERARAVTRARTTLVEACRAQDRRPPDWLAGAGLLHEAVAHDPGASPLLGEAVRADLHTVASALTPQIRRAALYDRMLSHFVRWYGSGGTSDVLSFCYRFLAAAPATTWQPVPGRPVGAVPAEGQLRGDRTLTRPSHVVFFQVAAGSAEEVARGDHLLVVNRIHSGLPGMVGRWAVIPALHHGIDEALTRWLSDLHPGCRVYQTSAHADWIEFQRPALRGLPRVGWGSELAEADGATHDLRGFTLAHDPVTHTLQVRDATAAPAAFAYLGAVPVASLHGVDRLLATLSDPWVLDLGDAAAADGTGAAGGAASPSSYRPRVQRGRIVMRRASWLPPPGELPRPGRGQSPVSFLLEVERWRARLGLPDEVFLSRGTGQAGIHHKPQWVGFDHPHAVWAAFRQIDDATTTVEITEALPGRDGHWAADPHQPAAATEFIAMLRQDGQ